MNEPSIEMMQSISVDFLFPYLFHLRSLKLFFLAFHLLQVGFLTRGQVTRAVAREFEGDVETTELMAREDFLGHPTKSATKQILTHQKRCMFLNFSLHFHDLLE